MISILEPAGTHAGLIAELWWLLLGVCTVVYIATMAALAAGLWRASRQPPGDAATAPPRRERRFAIIIGAAMTLTFLVLSGLVAASFLTDRSLLSLERDPAVSIEITGNQWWWDVRYTSPEPSQVFHTANELHLPLGRAAKITMRSNDVIHSLWIPSLNGKQDLIPGRQNTIWLLPEREGTFMGRCAEFCGHQHAHMALLVIVEPPDRFEAWRAAQVLPAREPDTDEQRRGRDVFLASSCVMCHTVRGTTAGGRTGPDLTHLAGRLSLAAATFPNSRGYLVAWITDPQTPKPGNHMPVNLLPVPELRALTAYLESLE